MSRYLVISPHLDDGVFSCGALLAGAPGSIVATVFAGVPPRGTPAPPWDRQAGFASGDAAILARRAEDRQACALLGAQPVWCNLLDHQYETPCSMDAVRAVLAPLVQRHTDATVLAPLGLFHSDHLLVSDAARQVCLAYGAPHRWRFYEDALYRRDTQRVQDRLAAWRAQGLALLPLATAETDEADLTDAAAQLKATAVCAYASQLALFSADALADLRAPERYWTLPA